MKGDLNESRLLTRDMRPHSSYVSTTSTDYLTTTMKLRDHVLASKSKKPGSSNKLIRNMRSAPPFQNRNLDNYPMPYNREDAVRSARGQRADKRNNAVRMTRWRAESGLMREYSKQMFDFSVHSAKTSGISNGTKVGEDRGGATRSKSETDYYIALRTNGPTPDGNVLHNRRQKVLNSIRIRPHTECQTQFKHERSTSSSNVEHAICDKNRRYRVQSMTESSTRPDSHYGNVSLAGSEFIFIPVDESSAVNGWVSDEHVANSRRITFDSSLSESNETDSLDAAFGKDPFDDFEDKNNTVTVDHTTRHDQQKYHSTSSPYSRKLLPPSVSSNIRLVSLDEASASESEEEKVEPVEEVKKPEPPPPPPPEKPKSKTRGKKGSKLKQKATKVVIVEEEKKAPEPEPEPEPVKVKLILKGPHCWVDDATITSEPPDPEELDCPDGVNPTSGEQLETNAEKQNSAQRIDMAAKTKSLLKDAISANTKPSLGTMLKQPNQQAMKDAFDKALHQTVQSPADADCVCGDPNKQLLDSGRGENELIKEQSAEEKDKIILPPFLCPSSEKKSREAALKDWLANSCFRTAHKGVPIV
ncbi:hypothetical protein ACF0H5_005117 [Mactra antiquata]